MSHLKTIADFSLNLEIDYFGRGLLCSDDCLPIYEHGITNPSFEFSFFLSYPDSF